MDYSSLEGEDWDRAQTWDALNPSFTHEYMTDEKMEAYVREHFHKSQPDIEALYMEVQDPIIRSDLIRYLILLSSGGAYNDLDVSCLKPISQWLPSWYSSNEDIGVVLGVEVDNDMGPDGRTPNGTPLFELVNWTLMSKPNQPFLWFLILRVCENLRSIARLRGVPLGQVTFSQQDVLDTTGPAALTKAFFDYAKSATAEHVDYRNLTKMTEAKAFGEVVVLPIWAFGAGHQVQWAGWEDDQGRALVHHHFKNSWRGNHVPGGGLKGESVGGWEVGEKEKEKVESGGGGYVELDEGGMDPEKAIEEAKSKTTEGIKTEAAQEGENGATNATKSLWDEDLVQPANLTSAASNGTSLNGTVLNGAAAANASDPVMRAPEPSLSLIPG